MALTSFFDGLSEVTIEPKSTLGRTKYVYTLMDTKIATKLKTRPILDPAYGQVPIDLEYTEGTLNISGKLHSAKEVPETDLAKILARAVLSGEEDAIFPLIDYLLENRNRTNLENEIVAVVRLSKEYTKWINDWCNKNHFTETFTEHKVIRALLALTRQLPEIPDEPETETGQEVS